MSNKIQLKRSNVAGKIPTLEQLTAGEMAMNTADEKLFFSSGNNIFELAKTTDYVSRSGDSMTGSLSLPKTAGEGILVNNSYGWIDVNGQIRPNLEGTNAVTVDEFIGPVRAYSHLAGSYGEVVFHIPHEYALGTNVYMHIHWGHNGTNITGELDVQISATYAKRTYPASTYSYPITTSLLANNLNMTNSPQYCHRVDEIQLSNSGGSTSMLDTDLLEVDGLIIVRYDVLTIPSITGSIVKNLPYFFEIDLHMQSTQIGTFNKDPNYYV